MVITKQICWVLALGKKESATSMDADLSFKLSQWNADTPEGRRRMLQEALRSGYVYDMGAQRWKRRVI
jgi:hypothetical protein